MRVFLIGQRGVGKTSIQEGLVGPSLDLDTWISEKYGRSTRELFEEWGESVFRTREVEALHEILLTTPPSVSVSLGAGFPIEILQGISGEKIWVRRSSDTDGRIFLDRPRLDPNLSPLAEFDHRARMREPRYRETADWILQLPEGQHLEMESLRRFLQPEISGGWPKHQGIWTLLEKDRQRTKWVGTRLASWGFQYFEMRSDLLSEDSWSHWGKELPSQQVLLSYRRPSDPDWRRFFQQEEFYQIDWALELGPPPDDRGITVLSLHSEASVPVQESLRTLNATEAKFPRLHLKWSPVLETWSDLELALRWQSENPKGRSLLPRSCEGRWRWVRLWLKGRQQLHFVCEDQEPGRLDQPTLLEWVQTPIASNFAAILGAPVEHSWTPNEQGPFFRESKSWPVLRIEVRSEEWDVAWRVLRIQGLAAAAVTAPLKRLAFESCTRTSDLARELRSVNTLFLTPSDCWGENTDLEGFHHQLQSERLLPWAGDVMIWGGGGTLSWLKRLFPEAFYYSVRTGDSRDGRVLPEDHGKRPLLAIWAAGSTDPGPSRAIVPEVIIDLNYRENSRARAWALETGARYISGQGMFHAQAEAQRRFWSELMSKFL